MKSCDVCICCIRYFKTLAVVSLAGFCISSCGGGSDSNNDDGNEIPIATSGDFFVDIFGENGTYQPSSASVTEGETATFTIMPNEGYALDSATGCGGALNGNQYTTGPITENCNVEVILFELSQGSNVVAIASSSTFSAILTDDGVVRTVGSNVDAQTCASAAMDFQSGFTPVAGLANIQSIESCDQLTVVNDAGQAYSCGRNEQGELGINNDNVEIQFGPAMVDIPSVDTIRCSGDHGIAQTPENQLLSFGRGGLGIAAGANEVVHAPTVIVFDDPLLDGAVPVAFDAGGSFSVFAFNNGELWVTGDRSRGQAGDGFSSVVVNEDGSASSSGAPDQPNPTPVRVGNFGAVSDVRAGDSHVLVLHEDGTVRFWGANNQGQGGLGTGLTSAVNPEPPALIPGLENVVEIDAERNWSMALDSSGVVYAWGDSPVGASANTPTIVDGLPSIASISAGTEAAMFLASNGTVWGEGDDSTYAQFGLELENSPADGPVIIFDGIDGVVIEPEPEPAPDNGSVTLSGTGTSQLPAAIQSVFSPQSYRFDALTQTHTWTVSIANVDYNLSVIDGFSVGLSQTVNLDGGAVTQGFFQQDSTGVTIGENNVQFDNVTLTGSVLDPPVEGNITINGSLGTLLQMQ